MDADSPASRTALATARFRAAHQVLERGSILWDPLAVRIVGESEDDLRALDIDRRLRLFVCARARYAEEVLAAAVPLVATDFERDDLAGVLAGCIEVSRPVLFWWLGVTPYLTISAISATLTTLAALPHSAVVLDHSAADPHASGFARAWDAQRAAQVAAVGEPWVTRISPQDLARLGEQCGFDAVHLEDEAAVVRRARGRRRERAREPRVTHLALMTKGWWPDGAPGPTAQPRV